MSRRATLPGAAELFRATSADAAAAGHPGVAAVNTGVEAVPKVDDVTAEVGELTVPSVPLRAAAQPVASAGVSVEPLRRSSSGAARGVRSTRRVRAVGEHEPTGRERHEEKITVYCSAEELLDLETARLNLRAEHGLAVDRGRVVREAIAVVLADLQAKGEASILVRRLREQ